MPFGPSRTTSSPDHPPIIPRSSPLRQLYEWDPLKDLIEGILDRGPIHRYADPFGALNLSVMGRGDQLQWHFDQTDFVVSLAVQSAEEGGDFEVVPRIREANDEHYEEVAAVLGGDRRSVETLAMTAGDPARLRGSQLVAPSESGRGVPVASCWPPGL
jgi:hypothetical protein